MTRKTAAQRIYREKWRRAAKTGAVEENIKSFVKVSDFLVPVRVKGR
jgi:hypothetical protein